MRKRRQYQTKTYKLSELDEEGKKYVFCEGKETGLAENQVTELIQALKGRNYIEKDFNYIPELVFLDVKNIREKQRAKLAWVSRDGIEINGVKYKRFVRSTSMARTSKIAFIKEDLIHKIEELISLGKFNEKEEVVVSKFEGYMGLSFSTTLFIDEAPRNICVVDDSIFDTVINDRVKGIKDGELIEGNYDVNINLHDGMGLHSPQWGNRVAKALELDETPVGYQIRLLPGFKGMSFEIDFKAFYKEKGITTIKDNWGKVWNVEDLDCIWSTSMFKLADYFASWEEYIELREKYYTPLGLNQIGISSYSDLEVNPDEKTKMTYQYLQVLSLSRDEIVSLANYTKDTLERVYRGDIGATMAYLSLIAKNDTEDSEEDEILEENMIANKISLAISCNPQMINDPYVSQFLKRQLKKSIDDAKLGRIWVDGRYSFICQDPIMMLEIVGGLKPVGCLEKDEFYSKGEIGERAFFRSPLTHSSEVHKANLVENDLTDKWLSRYKNIIVMNGKDITAQKISGSDWDGDKYFITKEKEIVDNVMTHFRVVDEDLNVKYIENLPVVDIDEQRNRNLVSKEKRNKKSIAKYDLRCLDNKIGEITNISTYLTTFAMTHNKLHKIDKDLVLLRLLQGQEIDFTKHGVRTLEIPAKWDYIKQYKPYFLQKYKYNRNDCFQNNVRTANMNMLCRDIEKWENNTFKWDDWTERNVDTSDFLMDVDALNDRAERNRVKDELEKVYQNYRTDFAILKLTIWDNVDEGEILNAYSQFYDNYYYLVNQITDDKVLLSTIAVYLCYIEHKRDTETKSYQFPWVCTWEGLAITMSDKQVDIKQMPVEVDLSEIDVEQNENIIEFIGKNYKIKETDARVDGHKFIENEYEKIIERELKKQAENFELEIILVGFNEKSVEEVEQKLKNNKLKLGTKEYKGKNYATVENYQGYICSVRNTDKKHLNDDAGYIDLTSYQDNKIDVNIINKTNRSLTVKLKMLAS